MWSYRGHGNAEGAAPWRTRSQPVARVRPEAAPGECMVHQPRVRCAYPGYAGSAKPPQNGACARRRNTMARRSASTARLVRHAAKARCTACDVKRRVDQAIFLGIEVLGRVASSRSASPSRHSASTTKHACPGIEPRWCRIECPRLGSEEKRTAARGGRSETEFRSPGTATGRTRGVRQCVGSRVRFAYPDYAGGLPFVVSPSNHALCVLSSGQISA
jgi:hypothetical protein